MTTTAVGAVAVPAITDEMSRLQAAYAYANAGFYIGPCERGSKHPGSVIGDKRTRKGWQRHTSRDIKVITSWFAGSDYGLFIHAGRSDLWIADVDDPAKIHPKLQQAITELDPPYQATRTGRPGRGHYVFLQPPGRDLGNSLGRLANGWGEARGRNGVIIVQPSEHEKPQEGGCYQWVRTGPVPVLPNYVAELLPDAMESEEAATDAQVAAFLADHRQSQRPELLDIHIAGFQKKIATGESRHGTVLGPMAGAMREAKAGLLDAQFGADAFRSVFEPAVMQNPIGPKQGGARSAAAAHSEWNGILAWAVAQSLSSDPAETRARVEREVPADPFGWAGSPRAETNGSAPPPSEWKEDFWTARPILRHIRDFARSRRVGPWALLGCVMVRVIAAAPPNLVLPPLVGGQASINLFAGIVSVSGGGKGTAEAAAQDAIELPYVPTLGPGSGEGIGHLFFGWDKTDKELKQHTVAVILSAAEIDTLSALKTRQASTLFPELRKAWMGEPLGFAYVDKEKRLTVPRHSYRLCLSVGVQPANAASILEDHTAGTPQRFNWFPADDPDAPDERPEQPEKWPNPLIQIGTYRDHRTRREMQVCATGRAEIDAARLGRLRGDTSEALDGHALLAQLKVAAALALLDGRRNAITEDDWRLAGVVRAVSDQTRQHVGAVLERDKVKNNQARAHAEADRAIVVDNRMAEHKVQRVGRWIVRKPNEAGDWVSHADLRRQLPSRDRDHFEDAIAALKVSGQIEERQVTAPNTAGAEKGWTGGHCPPLAANSDETRRNEFPYL
jgi:hypothetical protein